MTALFSILLLQAAPVAHVANVVVYPDRAQVTRALHVACSGHATASFVNLPPSADPSTFRAHTSLGSVEGVRTEERTHREAFSAEARALDEKIRAARHEQAALRDALGRNQHTAQVAQKYTQVAATMVGREMSDGPPNTRAWSAAVDGALDAEMKASSEAMALNEKIRSVERHIDELQRARNQIAAAADRRSFDAEVLVGCPHGGSAEVQLTYLVGGASWQPAYEARADVGGSAVELATFATLQQSTGEPWTAARITLSTALPRQNATPPEIQPLSIGAYEQAKERKVLVRRDERIRHAESGAATGAGEEQKNLRAMDQGLSVQLPIPEPADIAGDGTPVRLLVARHRLKAEFHLRTAPRELPFVFRVADLTNSAPFPLLAGPLDAFGKSGLIARYPIERVAAGARFHLTFGLEESLRVKRTVVEEVQRDAGLLGNTRRFRYGYRFELANYLGRAEEVELADQIPVSELDDIKVEVSDKTTRGYELENRDGTIRWRLRLAPGEHKQLDLAFRVDVPSSYEAGGL